MTKKHKNVAIILLPMWSTISPPLGINYIGQSVRRHGYNAFIWDYNVKMRLAYEERTQGKDKNIWDGSYAHEWTNPVLFHEEILPRIQDEIHHLSKLLVKQIIANDITVVGFSAYSSCINMTHMFCKFLRKMLPEIKLIIGGPETARGNSIDYIFDRTVDAIIQNEGEESIIELIEGWNNGSDVAEIIGVQALNLNGDLLPVGRREVADMENLPVLDFDDFDWEDYSEDIVPIMMSRGCVALCTFCDEPNYWGKFRWRSPEHIFKELERNSKKYNKRFFQSMDSLLNGHHRNFKILADMIVENNLDIEFAGNVRVSKHMDKEFFQNLKNAGCRYLVFGLECGSQKILDLMKKNIKIEWAAQNFKDCAEVGIEVHANLIVGFPGEEEEDFQLTVDFLRENLKNISCINMGVGMSVGHGQDVFIHPERYDILLDSTGAVKFDEHGHWQAKNTENNIEVRQDRIKRLREFLSEYQVMVNPQI